MSAAHKDEITLLTCLLLCLVVKRPRQVILLNNTFRRIFSWQNSKTSADMYCTLR